MIETCLLQVDDLFRQGVLTYGGASCRNFLTKCASESVIFNFWLKNRVILYVWQKLASTKAKWTKIARNEHYMLILVKDKQKNKIPLLNIFIIIQKNTENTFRKLPFCFGGEIVPLKTKCASCRRHYKSRNKTPCLQVFPQSFSFSHANSEIENYF